MTSISRRHPVGESAGRSSGTRPLAAASGTGKGKPRRRARARPQAAVAHAVTDDFDLPKTHEKQTGDERARTNDWFRAALDTVTVADEAVADGLRTALPGSAEETALLKRQGTLTERRVSLNQAQEAFLASDIALRPPSQTTIDKTRQLAADLGARIAAERTAQAVLALLNDLAGLATKLTS